MGNILDKALNGRLNIGNIIIKSYGIKILGTNFTNGINNGYYEILDSEYMHMLVAEGILFLIVALILCCFVLKYTQLINNQISSSVDISIYKKTLIAGLRIFIKIRIFTNAIRKIQLWQNIISHAKCYRQYYISSCIFYN